MRAHFCWVYAKEENQGIRGDAGSSLGDAVDCFFSKMGVLINTLSGTVQKF